MKIFVPDIWVYQYWSMMQRDSARPDAASDQLMTSYQTDKQQYHLNFQTHPYNLREYKIKKCILTTRLISDDDQL